MKEYTYYFRHTDKPLVIYDDGEPTEAYSENALVTHNGAYGKIYLPGPRPLIRATINMRDVIATTIEEFETPEPWAEGLYG